jgi:hypothetical protein
MDTCTADIGTKCTPHLSFEAERRETAGRSTSSTPSEVRPLRVELTDWLDGVVRRAKEKYLEQRVQEEKLIEEEALKSRVGSQFCRELFEWLEGIDVRFNSRFGVHVLSVSVVGTDGDRSLQVLARPVRAQERIAILNYRKETKSVVLNLSSDGRATPTEEIRLVLGADSEALAEISGDQYTPEQLGRKIVEDLLA